MPESAFGSVPTPALVAPIEFTLPQSDYAALGGYVERIRPLNDVLAEMKPRVILANAVFASGLHAQAR
jgi:hypothetical protein